MELRQQPYVVKSLERFGALFAATEKAVTARGGYRANNLGRFSEGLASVMFTKEVGMRMKKDVDMESMRIFAKARKRCFELLGQPVGDDSKLEFLDFFTGRALAVAGA